MYATLTLYRSKRNQFLIYTLTAQAGGIHVGVTKTAFESCKKFEAHCDAKLNG